MAVADGFHVDTNGNLWLGSDRETFDATTRSEAPFYVYANGDLVANSGTFSGDISGASGTFTGSITGASGTFTGDLSGSDITGGTIDIGSGTFTVDSAGAMVATSATITGSITSTSGTIGGWTIGSTELSSGNISIDSTGSITGDYTSGSAGWSINSDGTAEFNNVTVRGTLDGPNLTGNLTGNTSSSIQVGGSSQDFVKLYYDSTFGGSIRFDAGGIDRFFADYDAAGTFSLRTGLSTDLELLSQGGDMYFYSDTIYFRDNPLGSDAPILKLWNGSSYVSGNNQVLGADSSGNLEWTTVASSAVTSISGAGEITVTESSGAYTIEHADSDHNTSFASLTSYISHVGNTSAHSYSPITINGLTMEHGFGLTIQGGGDIGVSSSGNPHTITISHDDSDHSYSSSNVSVSAGSVTSNAGYFLRTLSANNNVITYNRSDFGSDLKINGQRPTSNNGSSVGLSATQYNEVHARYGYFDFITGGNVSSQEIKTDITDLSLGLDFINALEPKKYKYKPELKEDDGKFGFGFIAEDIETLLNNEGESNSKLHQDGHTDYPNYGRCVHELICVCEDEDCCSPPTETYNADTGEHTSTEGCMFDAKCTESCCTDIAGVTIDGINYIHATEAECEEVYIDGRKYASILKDELVAPLVKAVQELSAKNDELESRLAALEA